MLDTQQLFRNQRSLDHAVAQQKLEGLTVPKQVVDDMKRAVRGEITSAEVIQNIYLQFPDVEIFRP